MIRSITVAFVLFCASVLHAQESSLPFRPGEVLIKFRGDVDVVTTSNAVASGSGGKVLRTWNSMNAVHIRLPLNGEQADDVANLKSTIKSLASNPAIEWAQPNYIYYADELPSDPDIATKLWFLDELDLEDAWDIRTDAGDIVVAVIDTGVMLDHPDIQGNLWRNPGEQANGMDDDGNGIVDDLHGADFVNRESNLNPDGDPSADKVSVAILTNPFCIPHSTKKRYEAHGTHVAGSIGAVANNNQGIAGIAWNVQIMPLKFLGGSCGSGDTADAVDAILYAIDKGADIINCSWGGGSFDQALKEALEDADDAGILVVCAAGNSGKNNDVNSHYPSSYSVPNILAVAASDQNDKLAKFTGGGGSNFGATTVDLAAPGKDILSTIPTGNENSAAPSVGYDEFSGTSMATPITSGAAALVMAQFPTLTHREVKAWLLATVDKRDAFKNVVVTGGRLNVATALTTPVLPDSVRTQLAALPDDERERILDRLTPTDRIRASLRGTSQVRAPVKVSTSLDHSNARPMREWKVIVAFNSKLADEEVCSMLKNVGEAKSRLINSRRGTYLVHLNTRMLVGDFTEQIRKMKEVRYVQTPKEYRAEED